MPNHKQFFTLVILLISVNLFSQSFTSNWNTNNIEAGSSAANQITIPTNPAYTTYSYDVDWGDNSTDNGVTGDITHTYATAGTYTISISGTFPSIYFNDETNSDKLKIIEILSWGTIQWQTMENAFYGCKNLNFDSIDAPDLSQVTSLKQMFRDCTSFNGIVNNWDVSTITDISGMFYGNSIFNRPLDLWVTSSITDMSQTFYSAPRFNEPLDNWNTGAVTNMMGMFNNARDFNQNINNWNVSQVTNMSGTFSNTNDFNMPLSNWDVSKVTDMSYMFNDSGFNQPIENWDVSKITDMSHMFSNGVFNKPIGNWIVSLVEDMSFMFQRNRTFNQPLNNWNTSKVTNMESMFDGYYWDNIFNYPIDNWDVSAVTNMKNMFRDNSAFNQPIGNWIVNNVSDMEGMFSLTDNFNQHIDTWNVSKVTNMQGMFNKASVFNQPLNSWNVENVTNVSSIFYGATDFNQPLNSWNLLNATNFTNMFNLATSFNEDITGWDTSMVTNMSGMFNSADSFNQNIGVWNISSVANMSNIFNNSGISQENYDNILIAWSIQTVIPGINLGATNLQYCDALTQRQSLIDDDGWNITGDAVNCSYVLCTDITMPHASDTATPANSDIRWDAAPNATGYRVTIEVERGGVRSYVTINGSPANNYDVGNVVGVSFTNEFMANDMVFVTVIPYNDEGPATGCQEINFTVVESWVNSPDAFKLTYDTTIQYNSYTTPINQLKIQTQSGVTYDYNIDWGDGQYDNNVTGDITHTYLNPGIYTVSIIGTFPAPKHEEFNSDAAKLLTIDQWGTQIWEKMYGAFAGCLNMEYNAIDIPNLSNVEDMGRMFIVCKKFDGNINNWDVSNVTNMYGMFGVASKFNQPLNSWDVSNVTNMNFMFAIANEFNQDISSWNVGNVVDMARMFQQTDSFNQPLNSWNVSNVTDMSQLFYSAKVFDQPLNLWNVAKVEEMDQMFYSAEVFNQNIDSWDVSSVSTMSQMFFNAIAFNEPLNSWDVSSVTTMASMFYNAETFNQPLDTWDVSSVSTMASMFSGADSFNQNIDSWNVTNVTNMSSMFSYALSFDQPLNSWDVNSVVNMSSMFRGAALFNQPLGNWNVSAVATMNSMFENAVLFNQPINSWNVSSVTLMESMFENATVFDQPLNNWNTSVVTNFEAMFKNALGFNAAITNWNTGEALTMQEMFSGATAFNQNIDPWDVSFVTTMEAMFNGAITYNQNMNSWNVASVTTMEDMFKGATAFNEDISAWNVRGVNTMEEMFSGALAFNQNLNNWRINGVSNMNYMFREATAYNQPMNLWNLGNVSMRSTFYNATNLNQNLGDWDVSGVTDMSDMLDNTALIRENYDNTLIAWSEQTLTPGITLGAQGLPYCDAQEERQLMIGTYGWTFSQDVRDCPIPECTQLASPLNGETNVPVNTNLTWNSALFAQGYYLTVGTSVGGNDIVNNETVTNETSYEFASDFNTGDTVYVTIIPFNDEGDPGSCMEESFTISNSAATIPECTSLSDPLNDASDVLITSNLSWNPISNADGYKITVGTSTGASDILNAEDVGNINTYEFITDLPEDSDIFVTIIPYNDEGEPGSCTEERFHTEIIPVPPTCTNLISPVHLATDVAIDTNISWTAVPEATGYLVIVGTTEGGNEIVNNVDVNNATTYDIPDDLLESRTYYVTIIPYNDVDDATGCIEESFTTGDSTSPPSCPILSSPTNGSTQVALDANLIWNGSGSADGYSIKVGTSSGGTEIFMGDLGDLTTYDFASDLPESETIYVSIIAYNGNGSSDSCAEYTFETVGPPECTSLISPANNDTNIAVDASIEWNAIADADGYRLTVIGSNSTANNMTDFEVTSGTTFDFANDFIQGETVTLIIKPYNINGEAFGCTYESFTIISPPAPGCTSLISPLHNTLDADIDTDISWNAVSGATGYTISVTASESTVNNLTDVDVLATSYDFTNDFIQGETVTVTIKPFNDSGEAVGCGSETFTIKPVPSCTNLAMPTNNAVAVDANTSISWNAVSDAIGYFVTVSGRISTVNNLTAFKTTGTTYDFNANFNEGETVEVTIVPYNESGLATGCLTESFTIEAVPTCTTLTFPADGSIDIPVDTSIEWQEITEAVGYILSVEGNSSSANNVIEIDITTGNTYNFPSDFEQGETVTVTIKPYNNVGAPITCSSESFTIKSIPNCTNLISPSNGDTLAEVNEISWNSVSDADGYKLIISAETSTANNVTDLIISDTNYTFPNEFNKGEIVMVTITPFNEVGENLSCTSQSFTIRPLPSCTNLISSLQNRTDISVATDIEWNSAFDADGYRISIGTSINGTDIVNNEDVASLTNYTLSENLPSETTIYVSIEPYNTSGITSGCSSDSFTTEVIIPDCAVLLSPANGETDVSLESAITWSEVEKTDGYRLSIGTSLGANDILDTIDVGTATSYTHSKDFPFDTELFVTITPYNSAGQTIGCEQQSFTTMIPEDETKYGFSPDGDGINEYWHIENIDYYPVNVVSIFNRWGDIVFKIENYDNASKVFSGNANMKTSMGADVLPTGTYFFNIEIEGETILRKTQGFLVLKR